MRKSILYNVILITIIMSTITTLAQEVQVPDLSGLSVPEAAAQLNDVGLALGTPSGDIWTDAIGVPENTIGAQSLAAGTTAAAGSVVDVTLYNSANAFFIYDENDVSFVNTTGESVNMREILFQTGDGSKTVEATEWGIAFAEPSDCFQLWSIPAREAKIWQECNLPIYWRSTNNTDFHFWTQVAGVSDFVLLQDGIERARCDAAPAGSEPIRCDFYVATLSGGDTAPYIYMAYTTDSFVMLNNTDDQWMPTDETPLFIDPENYENTFDISDASRYADPNPVADLTQLAPSQCIQLTAGNPDAPTSEPCTIIAQSDLAPADAFWQNGFEVNNNLIGALVSCPPATPDRLTVCIMPL